LDETAVLGQLEALAHTLGIQVRYECLYSEADLSSGGLCRIRDKQVIIVNTKATTGEKARTLVRALKRFDLSNVYLRPALRDLLEEPAGTPAYVKE
jgi:hypothetical protein